MSEQELSATYDEHVALLNSLAWRDLSSEVRIWLDDIRSKLETEDDISEIKRFQGIAEACRHFINLPQSIVDTLRTESNG